VRDATVTCLGTLVVLPTRTVYVDVTLTRSKVKVTDHLNFRQLPINAHFQVYILCHFRMELKMMVDIDSMGPLLQLVEGRFSNFLLGKVSLEFKLHGMSIFHDIQWPHISVLGDATVTWWVRWSSYIYCVC